MKPLIVLISTFLISVIITKIVYGSVDFSLSGRISMSVMLLFTAMAHFVFTKGMTMMLPNFIPFKSEIIYLTGIIEIFAAIGLFLTNLKLVTAWLLIVFFIVILPANIYAALQNIDYQKGTSDGNGLTYLWFRIPLQILFISWTYFFAIQN